MPLVSLVVVLIVVGVLLWLLKLNQYGGAYGKILTIINVVVGICVVFWLLQVGGLLPLASQVTVPRIR